MWNRVVSLLLMALHLICAKSAESMYLLRKFQIYDCWFYYNQGLLTILAYSNFVLPFETANLDSSVERQKLLNDFQLLKLFLLVMFFPQTKKVASSCTLSRVPEELWSNG